MIKHIGIRNYCSTALESTIKFTRFYLLTYLKMY